MTLGEWPKATIEMVDFMVMDLPSAYNTILGRVYQSQIGILSSMKHQLIKYPTNQGIGVIRGDQPESQNCYYTHIKKKGPATLIFGDHETMER